MFTSGTVREHIGLCRISACVSHADGVGDDETRTKRLSGGGVEDSLVKTCA